MIITYLRVAVAGNATKSARLDAGGEDDISISIYIHTTTPRDISLSLSLSLCLSIHI